MRNEDSKTQANRVEPSRRDNPAKTFGEPPPKAVELLRYWQAYGALLGHEEKEYLFKAWEQESRHKRWTGRKWSKVEGRSLVDLQHAVATEVELYLIARGSPWATMATEPVTDPIAAAAAVRIGAQWAKKADDVATRKGARRRGRRHVTDEARDAFMARRDARSARSGPSVDPTEAAALALRWGWWPLDAHPLEESVYTIVARARDAVRQYAFRNYHL